MLKSAVLVFVMLLCLVGITHAEERPSGIATGTIWWGNKVAPHVYVMIEGDDYFDIVKSSLDGTFAFKVPVGRYSITAPGQWADQIIWIKPAKVTSGKITTVDFFFH